MMRFNANSDAHGGTCGQIGRSQKWLVDSILRPHRCDKERLSNHEADNSKQTLKNRNKRSHNTGFEMPKVFINSKSGLVKQSHKRPYVTLWSPLSGSNLEKQKSKAQCTLQGQCINGALAGEWGSKLPERSL